MGSGEVSCELGSTSSNLSKASTEPHSERSSLGQEEGSELFLSAHSRQTGSEEEESQELTERPNGGWVRYGDLFKEKRQRTTVWGETPA